MPSIWKMQNGNIDLMIRVFLYYDIELEESVKNPEDWFGALAIMVRSGQNDVEVIAADYETA